MAAALEVEVEEVVETAELVDELVVGTGLADDVLDTGTEMASEVAGLDDAASHCQSEQQAGMQRTRGGRSRLATISITTSAVFCFDRGSESCYIPLSETAVPIEGHRKECGMKRVGEWEKEEHLSRVTLGSHL